MSPTRRRRLDAMWVDPFDVDALSSPEHVARAIREGDFNVKARGLEQCTPLHIAAHQGYTETVEVLIGAGAELDAVSNNNGFIRTPLYEACFRGHTSVARRLLDAGADPNAQLAWKKTILHYPGSIAITPYRMLVAAASTLDTQDSHGNTPAHMAVWRYRPRHLDALIDAGAALAVETHSGQSVYALARTRGKPDLISQLDAARRRSNLNTVAPAPTIELPEQAL